MVVLDEAGSARFWAKVDRSGECWVWTAALGRDGYGRFGVKKSTVLAHRVAYVLCEGPIPQGVVLDHLCHNRACVRPAHLRQTDNAGNGQNRRGAQRNNLSTGVRGVTAIGARYRAQVKHNRRNHFIGDFDSLVEAEGAAIAARAGMFLVPGGSR